VTVLTGTALAVTALSGGPAAVASPADATASQQADAYVIEQGDECTEIEPLSEGEQSVEEFYGYTTDPFPPDVMFSANTPTDIEETNNDTSSMFLYQGPDELALVFIHGGIYEDSGGAATMEFEGLPDDGEWVVRDDPSNQSVEVWNRTTDRGLAVDWGWRDAFTDGGAFAGGLDADFEVTIYPSFNEDAAVDPVTDGDVTTWRALSATDESYESVDLSLEDPVTVRTGTCA
jgi:hypothetical protein